MDVSVIIPARNEKYLQETINDILSKARSEIEIIVSLDGYWPEPPLKDDKRVTVIHSSKPRGMRTAINAAADIAKGKFLLKCDAHCAFEEGFDIKMAADCCRNWLEVPVRYSLDIDKWERTGKKYEFEYISCEDLKGRKWPEFTERVKGQIYPDLMTFQGSCWFMHRQYFYDIGCLDDVNYGSMGREAQELSLKVWLGGGQCKVNRNTWYAHWSKPKSILGMKAEKEKSVKYAVDYWKNYKGKYDINWLVHKFAPVPTWDLPTVKESGKDEVIMRDTNTPATNLTDSTNAISPGLTRADLYRQSSEKGFVTGDKIGLNKSKVIKKGNLRVHPGLNRPGLYRLFANRGFKRGAEIGVQRARNAFVMLENIPGLKLFLVEPYKDHTANKRKWGKRNHAKFRRMARNRLKGQNVVWLENFSEIAAYKVPDNSLDFVYIDGEHTWDYVIVDLVTWYRKVRKGGIISGHDFEYRGDFNLKGNAKVAEALMHFMEIYKIKELNLTDRTAVEYPGDGAASWYFEK
jgi:glycosyltransferase involved in cell wall biosynthesis